MPTLSSFKSWLRQTTTVQGLAGSAMTAVTALAGGTPGGGGGGGPAAAAGRLAMPGAGDLSGKISAVFVDLAGLIANRGSLASIGALARDGLVLAGSLPGNARVIPVPEPVPAAVVTPATAG